MSDRDAILTLLARYCFITDRGSADELAALFWEDCTVDFGGNVHEGREAAHKGFARWIGKMRDPVEGLRHILHTPLIEIAGDTASSEAYYDADCHSRKSGRAIRLRGLYRTAFERRDGDWRILRHEVQIWRPMDPKPAGKPT
ncbi:MAG: nuclear transport factor 2 family protein [Hyphomonas sp.]|nr:nuclear transport factor 2 family protein [Hyphomonas sp.]